MPKKHLLKTSFLIAIAIGGISSAQTPEKLTFEVASVKPAPPITGSSWSIGSSGGGVGTRDPTRYKCSNCTLLMMLTEAYGIKPYQISVPGWMNTELYEVSAKVPEGVTKEQVHVMLQNLLAERFKLTLHHEQREMQVYELVVAKGGSKLIEHVDSPPKGVPPQDAQKDENKEPVDPDRRLQDLLARARGGDGRGPGRGFGPDGYPTVNKDCKACASSINGKTRMQANGQTMADFAAQLTIRVGKPVKDATGLTGKYDYSLTFDGSADFETMRRMRGVPDVMPGMIARPPLPPPPSDSGTPINPSDPVGGIPLEAALQAQLGLKLELKKAPADMIVVDHAEKTPTEN